MAHVREPPRDRSELRAGTVATWPSLDDFRPLRGIVGMQMAHMQLVPEYVPGFDTTELPVDARFINKLKRFSKNKQVNLKRSRSAEGLSKIKSPCVRGL
jgi:hypothetical protein